MTQNYWSTLHQKSTGK